ncbi:MAG: hypothetical protein RBS80_25840, partial [Thermoguttaceae bacterium]|nr:hypothetical protein [Thermoguttaceae bacterium]
VAPYVASMNTASALGAGRGPARTGERSLPKSPENSTRTHHQAALAGHAGFWTSDDVEAARRQSNAFHYPDGHGRPTPLERWESRAPISESERDGFRLTAENLAVQIHQDTESTSQVPLTAADTAAQHRRVIRRALVEHGYLSTKWRFITLPLKPKKSARIT